MKRLAVTFALACAGLVLGAAPAQADALVLCAKAVDLLGASRDKIHVAANEKQPVRQ